MLWTGLAKPPDAGTWQGTLPRNIKQQQFLGGSSLLGNACQPVDLEPQDVGFWPYSLPNAPPGLSVPFLKWRRLASVTWKTPASPM